MIYIVPDTNFLIYTFKHKINLDYEIERAINTKYKIIILDKVKDELEYLLKNKDLKGKEKLAIKLALNKIKNYELVETDIDGEADIAILEFAKKHKDRVIVATNDKELKNKLLEENIPIMVVRQKKYFEVFGMV
ncbi:PIN domain-containing protein [Methanocaldococcus indicus]|uniref:type II toxin-antitoxin system VapC family toxin n=1 Tax=Methanocaldococcus indicus TaxID=213231 RepID=UPI003C6D7AC2